MAQGQPATCGVLAMLLAMGSIGIPVSRASQTAPQPLAQQTTEVIGELSQDSQTLDRDDSYYNVHSFEAQAGVAITIEMKSKDFDTYLILVGPNGEVIAHNDDGSDGTNSSLSVNLPLTGTYQIFANSYDTEESGQYVLTWEFTETVSTDRQETPAQSPQPSQFGQNLSISSEIAANSVTGQLSPSSQVTDDSRYFNVHTFEGIEGATVLIRMTSDDFETYLALGRTDGSIIAQNTDWSWRNSQIIETLPYSGTYQIVATHYLSEEEAYRVKQTGQYRLTWRSATAEDITEANAHEEALALARELRIQAVKLSADEFCCDEALRLSEEALKIYREQLGERHPNVADNLLNLGDLYAQQLRYREAEALLLESVRIYRENLIDQSFILARSLNSLAIFYENQGRYDDAEKIYIEALNINRQERPDYVPSMLDNLGGLYIVQGRYNEAELLHLEALELRRERFEERSLEVASSLGWLAYLYKAQGRYDEAEPLFLQVLEIDREQGMRRNDIAIDLNNLALIYYAQGRYSEADPLFLEAISLYRELLQTREGVTLINLATSLRSLANSYISQGRYAEAEAILIEAQEIYLQNPELGELYIDNAPNLNALASIYQSQGAYLKAEPILEKALTIYRQKLGNRHPDVANSLKRLASLRQAKGNIDQAISLLQEGLDIEEWNLNINLASLADEQRQAYTATLSDSTDRAISLSIQSAPQSFAATQLALTTLLRRKGRILTASRSNLQRLRQNATPENLVLLNNLTDVRRQLAAFTFNPPQNLPPDRYQTLLAELEAKENDLSSTLARRSAVLRAEAEPVEIAKVQAQLPANSVLVEYARYHPYDARADLANQFGAPRYVAYLLFPNGRIQAIDLGDAAKIDAAVQSFARVLQDHSADFQRAAAIPTIRPDVVEGVTDTLKTLVFDPIAPYLQNAQHLLISPDGQLNRLPFEALQPETGGDYLVQQYQISYLTSGRDLLEFNIARSSNNPAIILANPDYETADNTVQIARTVPDSQENNRSINNNRHSTELSQLQVKPLPGTAAEAQAIAPLLPNARLFDGMDATENVLKTVQAPRILHIATHGFFLQDIERPDSNRLSLSISGNNNFLATSVPPGRTLENPLLRSGLALAGFNNRSSGNEDGVLTALEASNLNLSGTQLVVLSACETGLGDISNGEGIYGLRRAFALAGAETQLMSLWQVSDFGTKGLMTRYYEKLMNGMGRSEALRSVQLEMIEEGGDYSHPYYWAAFVLAGEWRSLE